MTSWSGLKLEDILKTDLDAFWRWWMGELIALLPAQWQRFWKVRNATLIFRATVIELSVFLRTGDQLKSLGSYALDEQGWANWQQQIEANEDIKQARTLLCLDKSQCLIRQFKLPLAAAENLQQVLGFEIDRITPFRLPQVYYSGRVIETLKSAGQIRVELVVVPKNTLDPLLEQMQMLGWQLRRVDIVDDWSQSHHQLLPERFSVKPPRLPVVLHWISGLLVLVLAALLLFMPLNTHYHHLDVLQSELRKVNKQAKEVEELKQQAESLMHQMSFLSEKKNREPSMLDMLNELTRALPNDTWLNGLQYKDGKVVIQGQSPAASSLIGKLEASPYFKGTSFLSPVTKDLSNGLERFQISLEVVNGRLSESPHHEAVPDTK